MLLLNRLLERLALERHLNDFVPTTDFGGVSVQIW